MINAKELWVWWRMYLAEGSRATGDNNCRSYHPTETLSSPTEYDTVLSPKFIRTFHRTDSCSAIITALSSRWKWFSSKLATYLRKYPQICECHSRCCGELRTYVCSCLSSCPLDVSKRRSVRVILWCLPYRTSLRSLFDCFPFLEVVKNFCFSEIKHRLKGLIIK